MDPVDILQRLEPVFFEAGKLAYTMQQGVRAYNKRETGNPVSDIVTEADLAVQEHLLKAMSQTELRTCRLLAEEDTPSVKLFDPKGKYYLGVDPIDDTAIYAMGGEHFSTIVSLHDGKHLLYQFLYFPAWEWTHRVVRNAYSVLGATPDFSMPQDAKCVIAYWDGAADPERTLPQEVLKRIKSKGLTFRTTKSMSGTSVSLGPFIAKKVAGVYEEHMNAYDGLTELSIALATGRTVYTGGPHGVLDLTDVRERGSGLYYPGWYVALNV